MKTYTLRMPDGKNYVMTDEICDELNRTQGRKRLTGGELDALVMLQAGMTAVDNGAERLKKYAKERNQLRRMMPAIAQLHKAADDLTDHIEARQFVTVHNNFANVTLTISSLPVPQYTNVEQSMLSEIVTAASLNCAATCTLSQEESKRCKLRKAFSTIPGLKQVTKDNAFGLGGCPYMTVGGLAHDDEE